MMENRSFQKMARNYSSVLIIFLCAIFITCVFGHRSVSMASQNEKQQKINSDNLTVQMEYYQYNVCASCHPEDDFFAVVSDTISPIKQKYPYEIAVYNTFRAEDKKRFEKRLQELMLKETDVSLPTLIMISEDSEALVCLSGLDEIKEKLEDTLKQAAKPGQFVSSEAALESDEKTEAASLTENENQDQMQVSSSDWKEQLREAVSKDKSTDSVILYFYTVSCTDCSEVKSLLKKMTDEQTTKKPLVIHEFNIAEGDNVVFLQKLFTIYDVASDKQQVPIVFFSGGYLSGAKAVTQGLEQKWKDDELTGFNLENILSDDVSGQEENKDQASFKTYIGLAAAGFINGVNPCGASMLLMLLAAIAMSGRSVIKTGCAYLAGKFAAYCAMGMGLYKLFMAIGQDIFLSISNVLTWIFAAVFFILAILYLIDFVNVKRKQYGKIRMQLPTALRKWNHERIEKASKINAKWMIPAAVVLGIVISAGEFFCTGQVYLAAILYMMKMQQEMKLQTNAAFIVYVTAMCIPSFLIVLVIEKTKNVIHMSNKTLEWLPAIKLVTAIVFFIFAVFMLIQ
mgnify:FL=1